MIPILVRATMPVAVIALTTRIVLLSMLLIVFSGIINYVCNESRNIVVVGD